MEWTRNNLEWKRNISERERNNLEWKRNNSERSGIIRNEAEKFGAKQKVSDAAERTQDGGAAVTSEGGAAGRSKSIIFIGVGHVGKGVISGGKEA